MKYSQANNAILDCCDNICLRPILLDSADDCIRILMDDLVKQTYMLPDFASQEDAYKLFLRIQDLSHKDDHYVRGIYLADTMIGFINDPEISETELELGWAIHPDYHNKGYCTTAVKLAIEELFNKGFARITAGAFSENIPSMRVMEKCGMHRIDKTEIISYRGKDHTCVFYEIKRRA